MEERERGPADGPGDADARLAEDWLAALIHQFVQAAGLLRPDQTAAGDQLSMSEWFALRALSGRGALAQRDLAAALGLEKSTVSRLLAGLERRGLVGRQRDPSNRRFHQVTLTQDGRAVLGVVAGDMLARHAAIFSAMTPSQRAALVEGLSALVRAMEQAPPLGAR